MGSMYLSCSDVWGLFYFDLVGPFFVSLSYNLSLRFFIAVCVWHSQSALIGILIRSLRFFIAVCVWHSQSAIPHSQSAFGIRSLRFLIRSLRLAFAVCV